jgi:hypothetical protein
MAIWRLRRVRESGETEIDAQNVAVVEAVSAAAARTAAEALDSRFPSGYWDNAVAEDLEAAAYLGGTFTEVTDLGF